MSAVNSKVSESKQITVENRTDLEEAKATILAIAMRNAALANVNLVDVLTKLAEDQSSFTEAAAEDEVTQYKLLDRGDTIELAMQDKETGVTWMRVTIVMNLEDK